MEAKRSGDLVGGFLKGLKVLEAFNSDRPKQAIVDISRATGLDRATCRRLLLSLVHAGYADHDGKFYWLLPRSLRLGFAYLQSASLPDLLQSNLEQLATDLGESCSASILDGDDVVYVARASIARVMSTNLRVGSRLPSYCSSMGRVLLAALPPEDARRRLKAMALEPLTPKTNIDVDALMAELARVLSQDYAIVDEELELGLRSIAVPIRNAHGQVVAAANVGTNAARISRKRLIDDYLPRLRAFQAKLLPLLQLD